ncbi:MAG: hypothetical protein KGQ57_07270, partial [Burkholderiales bacterium]|nr:hypothetical protein [Burkholderiales bacterium]
MLRKLLITALASRVVRRPPKIRPTEAGDDVFRVEKNPAVRLPGFIALLCAGWHRRQRLVNDGSAAR